MIRHCGVFFFFLIIIIKKSTFFFPNRNAITGEEVRKGQPLVEVRAKRRPCEVVPVQGGLRADAQGI